MINFTTIDIKKKLINKEGFTLIELLIVMAIIGVLAALLMVNFIGVRQRARDGQRKTDLRQIQTALELYRADTGTYPSAISTGGCLSVPPDDCGLDSSATIYIQDIPGDPIGDYAYNSGNYCLDGLDGSGSTYALVACLENSNDNSSQTVDEDTVNDEAANCAGGENCVTGKYYLIKNP